MLCKVDTQYLMERSDDMQQFIPFPAAAWPVENCPEVTCDDPGRKDVRCEPVEKSVPKW